MLTFSSDGTFFRSGDTHPVPSGAHGAWRQIGDKEYDATYIASDSIKVESGSEAPKPGYILLQAPRTDNEFTGVAKVSTRDLQDKEIGTSENASRRKTYSGEAVLGTRLAEHCGDIQPFVCILTIGLRRIFGPLPYARRPRPLSLGRYRSDCEPSIGEA